MLVGQPANWMNYQMKPFIRGALLGALIQGILVFLGMLIVCVAEGPVFHAPEPWAIAAFYGAGGAVLGFVTGGIIGAILSRCQDKSEQKEVEAQNGCQERRLQAAAVPKKIPRSGD